MDSAPKAPIRIGLISLGCAKNLVDAEIMLGALARDGMEITNEASLAEVVIVNTCSFIDAAQEESVDTILESIQARDAASRDQAVVVAGCLPQRFREDLPKLMPEVDAFMGIDQAPEVSRIVREALAHRQARLRQPAKSRPRREVMKGLAQAKAVAPQAPEKPLAPVVEINARPHYIPDFVTPRFRLTPRHFAYVKIAEGCNHPCSFCIIPQIRGTHRSRAASDVVAEAKQLIESGVKELNLISQDTTYYGRDLHRQEPALKGAKKAANTAGLCALIRELQAVPGEFWIRLLYTHPAHWNDELIQTIAECPKVARYVDMPLQHIDNAMLERMRRETSRAYIEDLIANIRAGIPGIALRTTFIVGFPGETDKAFQTLLEFIAQTRFERLGVFAYSQEEGTRASKMDNQIADPVKKQRRDQAMAAQQRVARGVAESWTGKTMKVLVEKEASAKELKAAQVTSWEHGLLRGQDAQLGQLRGQYLMARGEADAPDIDGRVYVRGKFPVGQFAQVKIVGHTDYDLIAE
jgi:ribosomal protein S12 methylthiotransferase